MNFEHLDDILMAENPISEAKIVADGVSSEQYLAQPDGAKRGDPAFVLSGSDLMEFENCAHRWRAGYAEEETKSTEYGALLDCFLMDKEHLWDRFLLLPATYVVEKGPEAGTEKPWNWNANVCKAWREKNNATGLKTEVKNEVFFSAKGAAELILGDPQLGELFENSRKQVMITGIYADKETGIRVPVKALLDLIPPDVGYLVDLKSCNSAHPRAWRQHVFKYNYHVQSARHLDLWNAATGQQRNEFRHILQESFAPFEVAKRFLSSEYLALGRQKYIGALKRYAQCLATNQWPTYDVAEGANDILINGWLMTSPEPWMIQ